MSTQYTRALADEAKRQTELRNKYQQKYEQEKQGYEQAVNAYKTGQDVSTLNGKAYDWYNTIDAQLRKQQKDAEAAAKAEREQMNWFERTAHTVGDGLGRLVGGVMKFGENVMDAGATLFGADEEWIAKDHVNEWYGNALSSGTKGSYLNDGKAGEIIGEVFSGIGNMLPSIALNAIPGIGQAASIGSFMVGAGGQGMESALQNGATRNEALLYGTVSGISEGAIEKISGGIGGLGKGLIDNIGRGAIKTGIRGGLGRAAKTFVGEGLEEVASDLLDPVLAGIYKHNIDYSGVTPESLLDTFAIGGLSGTLLQGGQTVARKTSPTLDMRTKLSEIQEQNDRLDKRYNSGKLSEKQYNRGIFNADILRDETIRKFNNLNERKQDRILGKLGEETYNNLGMSVSDGVMRANTDSGEYNYKAMTPSLRGLENTLKYKPTADTLTAEQESVLKEHGKLTNGKTKIVFTDEIDAGGVSANGAYSDGVIYISKNTADPMTEVLKHEFTHSLENSKAYGKFADYVVKTISNDSELAKQYGDILQTTANAASDYAGVIDVNTENGAKEVMQEVIAHYSEKLLSDPKAIARIARTNKSMAGKILAFIQRKLAIAKSGSINKNTVKFLSTAEGLYTKAIRRNDDYKLILSDNQIQYKINKYSQKEIEYIEYDKKNKVCMNNEELNNFIKNSKSEIESKKLYLGKIDNSAVETIKKDTNLDLSDFNIVLDSNDIKHIFKNHGSTNENKRGQTPITEENFEVIIETFTNPNKAYVNENALILSKEIKGKVIAITIISNKKKNITLKSARIINKKTAPTTDSAEAFSPTSETESSLAVFNNSISKTETKVNEIAEKSPKNDIKYRISQGNYKKIQKKTYTRDDARDVTRELLSAISPGIKLLDENEITEKIYRDMNNPNIAEGGTAVELAERIVKNAYFEVYDADAVEQAHDVLEFFDKHIKKKYNLESIRGELAEVFGARRAGSIIKAYGSINGIDIAKMSEYKQTLKDLGIEIDNNADIDNLNEIDTKTVADYISSDVNKSIENKNANEVSDVKTRAAAGIFTAVYEAMRNARETVSGDKVMLKDARNAKELHGLVQKVIKVFQNSYDTHGSNTKLYKELKAIQDENAYLKKNIDSILTRTDLTTKIFNHIRLFKEWHKKGISADFLKGDMVFDTLAKSIIKIVSRGDIRSSNVRQVISNLKAFYTVERLNYDADPQVIADILELDKSLEGMDNRQKNNLTDEQLYLLNRVLGGMRRYVRSADSISINGERMRISELAERGIETLKRTNELGRRGKFGFKLRKLRGIVDPSCYFSILENCDDNGVIQMLYNHMKDAESNQRSMVIDFMSPFDAFMDKHRQYRKSLAKDIAFAGRSVRKDAVLYAYMLSKRNQAKPALYGYTNEDGKYYEGGGFKYENRRGDIIEFKVTEEDMITLEKSLTAEDRQYIALAEEFFQRQASEVKKETDIRLLGYTNVAEDLYYVPILRDKATIAKKISDTRDFIADVQNVSNMSFNKALTEKARNTIYLSGLFDVVASHAELVSVYSCMSEPMRNFDRVMMRNTNQGTPNGSTLSMQNELSKLDPHAINYIADLMQDMQGAGRQKRNKAIDFLRNGYIKSVLGLNPKTILSQFAGFGFAAVELSPKSIIKGISMKFDKAAYEKYSAYGRARDYNKTSVRAEGVTDKIGKTGDLMTVGIQKADKFMMHSLWNACLYEVEIKQGLKRGTEANYIAAAKKYEKVARLTQSNDSMSEKSAWQRSENIIVRAFTMFKSDAVKQLSRMVQSFSAWQFAAAKYKLYGGAKYKQELTKARRKFIRTISAATLSNAMYVAIALLFNLMLGGKDDEGNKMDGEDYLKQFFAGMTESFFGLFPIVSDIYNKISSGYDIENFTYSMLNDLTDGVMNVGKLIEKAVQGETVTEQEAALNIKKFMFSVGSMLGIPLRNLEKYPKMITGWISPTAVVKYDSLFYPVKKSALDTAISDGDDKGGKTVLQLLLANNKAGIELSDKAIDTMYMLYKDNYMDLPPNVPKILRYTDSKDGSEKTKTLNAKEYVEFKKEYSKASEDVNALVKSSKFATLTKQQKGEAIRRVYDYYYSELRAKYINQYEPSNSAIFAKIFGVQTMSLLLSRVNTIEPDKYPNGKPIPNTRKRKILNLLNQLNLTFADKQLILVLLNYSPSSPAAVKRYLNTSKLSKEEKGFILEKME